MNVFLKQINPNPVKVIFYILLIQCVLITISLLKSHKKDIIYLLFMGYLQGIGILFSHIFLSFNNGEKEYLVNIGEIHMMLVIFGTVLFTYSSKNIEYYMNFIKISFILIIFQIISLFLINPYIVFNELSESVKPYTVHESNFFYLLIFIIGILHIFENYVILKITEFVRVKFNNTRNIKIRFIVIYSVSFILISLANALLYVPFYVKEPILDYGFVLNIQPYLNLGLTLSGVFSIYVLLIRPRLYTYPDKDADYSAKNDPYIPSLKDPLNNMDHKKNLDLHELKNLPDSFYEKEIINILLYHLANEATVPLLILNKKMEIVFANKSFNKIFSRDLSAKSGSKSRSFLYLLTNESKIKIQQYMADESNLRKVNKTEIEFNCDYVIEKDSPPGEALQHVKCMHYNMRMEPIKDHNGTKVHYFLVILYAIGYEHLFKEEKQQNANLNSIIFIIKSLIHDIGNYINFVNGNLEIVLDDGFSDLEETRKQLETIISMTDWIQGTINKYKQFTTEIKVSKKPIKIKEYIIQLMESIPEIRDILYTVDIEKNLDVINVDPVLFGQVISNIIKNAIQAMKEQEMKKIKIEICSKEFENPPLEKTNDKEFIVISIRDSGPGIPKEQMKNIFIPYFTTKENGTGIGLAISRKIIKAHGGTIWVKNHQNRGAIFMILIPKTKN